MSPEGRRDDDEVARFVERFAALLSEAGIPRMPARVFAALLATDTGTLTATELAEELRASPAAISGAVRYLAQVSLISRVRPAGERRDHYRVHGESWYEAIANRDQLLARWTASLREGVDVLGPDTPAGERLADTLAFFDFMRREIPALLERWRRQRAHRRPQ